MQSSGSSSSLKSKISSSPLIKKRRLHQITQPYKNIINCFQDQECLSQSEVGWKETAESPPIQRTREENLTNKLLSTPVRIMKKSVTSPLMHSSKAGKSQSEYMIQLERLLKDEDPFDTTIENTPSDDLSFDLDDDDLAAIDRLDKEGQTQKPVEAVKRALLEDSYDEMFQSIPEYLLTSQAPPKTKVLLDDFGCSQVLPESPQRFPRSSSDPIEKSSPVLAVKRTPSGKAPFERHNSLPTSSLISTKGNDR